MNLEKSLDKKSVKLIIETIKKADMKKKLRRVNDYVPWGESFASEKVAWYKDDEETKERLERWKQEMKEAREIDEKEREEGKRPKDLQVLSNKAQTEFIRRSQIEDIREKREYNITKWMSTSGSIENAKDIKTKLMSKIIRIKDYYMDKVRSVNTMGCSLSGIGKESACTRSIPKFLVEYEPRYYPADKKFPEEYPAVRGEAWEIQDDDWMDKNAIIKLLTESKNARQHKYDAAFIKEIEDLCNEWKEKLSKRR